MSQRSAGFAGRLRTAREDAGQSIRGLAAAADLSQEGVRRLLDGGRSPGIDTAERLAQALGVRPEWLAYGRRPKEVTMDRFSTIGVNEMSNEILGALARGESLRDAITNVSVGGHRARQAFLVNWAKLESLIPSDSEDRPDVAGIACKVLCLWEPKVARAVVMGSFQKALASTCEP